jgi:MFS family permease
MTTPLSRNRNYTLLWGGQVLSEVGFSASMIAFPLLVLAVTGSAATSGLVLGVDAAAQLFAGLPAGALADRWNRKTIMLCCEAVQAVTVATLVVALWSGVASVAHMVAVAAVMGVCRAMFEPAEDASLPRLVPEGQLASAVALNAARTQLGQLSGTAIGGFLFAVGRVVPFLLDALTHAAAFVALAFLRLPPRKVERTPLRNLGREVRDGVRWMWRQRQLRVTALCAISLNLFFTAFYIVIIVLTQERGVPSGEIGVMAAMLGVGGLLGALVAPRLHNALSPYASIAGVFWVVTALAPIAIFIGDGYLMGLLFAAMAFFAPTANTTISTYQLLLTPDELRGRLGGVMNVTMGVAAALGPVLGGVLIELVSGEQAVLLCAAGMVTVTLLVSASRTLRTFPRHRATADSTAAPEEAVTAPERPDSRTSR